MNPHETVRRLAARLVPKRVAVWGTGLLVLSWFIYTHTMMVPGLVDRAGRFKGSDYIQFYVMGSLVVEGRSDALYDPDAHLAEGRSRIRPDLQLYASHPNYGPQVALAFAPFALLPYGWSLGLFLVLTTLSYGFSTWVIWKECPALRTYGPIVAVVAAASPLFLAVLRYGQASAFALLIWSLAFRALRRNCSFIAGLAIGCLVYKPQLGIVVGVVVLTARQWRIVAGALTMVVGQLGLAWLATGSSTMGRYFKELWTLGVNPKLVERYPSEIHSLRGLFQLLTSSDAVITACFLGGLLVALVIAARSWSASAPLGVRVGELVLLTLLASPHVITYDLVLLTLPLLVFADWAIQTLDHPLRPGVSLLCVLAYFSPFSSNIARVTSVQVSVIVLVILSWRMYSVCTATPRFRRAAASA